MIIIVEGCDKSGKSTIVESLSISCGKDVIIFKNQVKPRDKRDKEKIKWVYSTALYFASLPELRKKIIVFDRSYPTELVYSGVKRDYDAMKDKEWWELDQEIAKRALMIYCWAPKSELKKRFKKESEGYLSERDIDKILKRYEIFKRRSSLITLNVKTTNPINKIIDQISRFLLKYEHFGLPTTLNQ